MVIGPLALPRQSRRLAALPNHLLGARPYEEMPACVGDKDLPDRRRLAHVIAIADAPAAFMAAVGAGVATPAARFQAMAGDDWPARVRSLVEALDAALCGAGREKR